MWQDGLVDAHPALAAFRDCPLLLGLPESSLEQMAKLATLETRVAGTTLFLEGDLAHGLWIVQSGAVKVYKVASHGRRELILTIERPHQSIAELPLLDGGVYPAYGSTLEDSQLWFIPKTALLELFARQPQILLHLMRGLGQRLRDLVRIVETLSFQHVLGRLAQHLLERAETGLPFVLEKNAVIAAQLGTVHELITRNLGRLVQNHLLQLEVHGEKRTVLGFDRSALERLSTGEEA
jgi:CRP/FNR family transcriptional regulator, dissimilatory nitrate respiration regulator